MAGGLEPHLAALRQELGGPAVLSVLVALIAVAITFRELREPSFPPAPQPAEGAAVPAAAGSGVPLPSSSSSAPLSRSALAVRAGQEEQPQGRAAAGPLRRGEDAAFREGERGGPVKEFPLVGFLIF